MMNREAKANFSLQFISHTNGNTTYLDGIRMALEGGCRWIQLRMKGAADSEVEPIAVGAQKMCREAGAPFVMVGHIKTPAASGDDLPATLSPTAIDGWLRGELGFAGVVVSDSFAMGAIADYYDQTDAAVRFLQAGGDLILMTPTPEETYQGILAAVGDGTLTESRIDESVLRILAAKDALGLLA